MKKYIVALLVGMLVSGFPTIGWAATGVGDGVVIEEQSSAPSTPEAGTVHVYVDNTATPVLKMKDDAGTVTSLASDSSLTLDAAYDTGGAGAGKAIDVSDGAVALSNDDADANAVLTISHTGNAAGDGIVITLSTGSSDGIEFENTGTGYDIEGTGALWYATKAGALYGASVQTVAGVTVGGDLAVTGTTTLSGALYQAAIAAAAAGNANLTIDAAGNGTINVGSISTGAITLTRDTTASGALVVNGNTDIGNAATDTLTITSIIDGAVTLDDGTTDSPSLILKDATDETATIVKVDAGNVTVTPGAATESLQVLTGNLKVGNGTEGVTLNGNDAYVTGTFEVDGASQFDGATTFNGTTAFTGATNIFTFGAGEYVQVDAATTDSTTTAGALDINFDSVTNGAEGVNVKSTLVAGGGGSEVVSGIVLDLDDDSDAAGTVLGLDINSSDATGSSNVLGIRLGNALEQGISMTMAAAAQGIILDADTADTTATAGLIDIDMDTLTAASEAINIDIDSTNASGVVTGVLIDLDDDTSAASTLNGIGITSSDLSGHASTVVNAFYTSGCDAAFQADNGYVRIGTGSTPDVTPSDDDLFVEGTVEVDGASRFDGLATVNAGITGDGASNVVGMTRLVEEYADAGNTILAAEAGTVFTNTGDADGSLHTLPEASTCIGASFTFVMTAAQQMIVELDNADIFLHLTLDAGDQIQSSTVGDSITVMALDATNWGVISAYPLSTDWADGGP